MNMTDETYTTIKLNKEKITQIFDAIAKVNISISMFILLFTYGLVLILLTYSNTFIHANVPIDVVLVSAMLIMLSTFVYSFTFNIINENLISAVSSIVGVVLCLGLIPFLGSTYETSTLMLSVYHVYNPIIIWYIVYMLAFKIINAFFQLVVLHGKQETNEDV